MNILVSTKDIQLIRTVRHFVAHKRTEIGKIFSSQDSAQTKTLLLRHTIEIVICDIDTPDGCDFSIPKWIDINCPDTKCIIISLHTEFEYTSKAIELGCLSYVAKPVSPDMLKSAFLKSLGRLNRENQKYQQQYQEKYQQLNQRIMEENFWRELILENISKNKLSIEAEKRNVRYREDEKYALALLSIRQVSNETFLWDKSLLNFTLKNIASELVCGEVEMPLSFNCDGDIILLIPSEPNKERTAEHFRQSCIRCANACQEYLGCTISCYVCAFQYGEDLPEAYQHLLLMKKNDLSLKSHIIETWEKISPADIDISIPLPDFDEWLFLLEQGLKEALFQKIDDYLAFLCNVEDLNPFSLDVFHQSFLQMLYGYLEKQSLHIQNFLDEKETLRLYHDAEISLKDMSAWLHHIIERCLKQAQNESSKLSVDKIKAYIRDNIDRNLTRQDIADALFCNPDTLSRIFKKSMDQKLSDYIVQQKIQKAESLLLGTEKQISEIALDLGFDNVSYFCTRFKKAVGCTPLEYRKANIILPAPD